MAGAGLIFASIFINVRGLSNFGANINQIISGQEGNFDSDGQKNDSNKIGVTKSDIDQDGLSDDEEPLYRTDPLNPDTDGDGFLDGEEVAAGCFPTIPRPNDCGDINNNLQSSKSLTEELSELIAGGLLAGDLRPDSPNFTKSILALSNKTIQNTKALLNVDISELDLNLSKDDSKKSRQEYIDKLATIIEEYILLNSTSINIGTKSSNEEFSNYFSESLKSIKQLHSRVSQLSVPPSWAKFHKNLLTLLKKSENFYQNILEYEKDPMKSLLTLNSFSSLQDDYRNLVSGALQKIEEQRLKLPKSSILHLLSNQ